MGDDIRDAIHIGYPAHLGDNIRLYHESVVRIDKPIPIFTVWHHETPPSDVKQ